MRVVPGLGPAHPPMQPDHLRNLAAHGENWVEAGHRFLKDHADSATANFTQPCLWKLHEINRLARCRQPNGPRLNPARAGNQPQYRHRRYALPAATLTNQAKRPATIDRK